MRDLEMTVFAQGTSASKIRLAFLVFFAAVVLGGCFVRGKLAQRRGSSDSGQEDTALGDLDQDGVSMDEGDCDDNNPDIHPGALEVCDGLDNDCDSLVDEEDDSLDTAGLVSSYPDGDGDGYGDPGEGIEACQVPDGYVDDNTDCDDEDPLASPSTPVGCKLRGAWMWGNSGRTYDWDNVLGDSALEEAAIGLMQDYGIRKIYASLIDSPVTMPDAVASWNSQLDAAGIESHLLMGNNTWVCDHTDLLTYIDERLLAFNSGRDPAQHFDGLHLDIEPQALPGTHATCPYNWSEITVEEKRTLVQDLFALFQSVRTHLDQNGGSDLRLTVVLPFWYDNTEGTFYWETEQDRDQAFADLGAAVDGISITAFCRDGFTQIDQVVHWELDHFAGETRIGLNAYHLVGSGETCETWDSVDGMLDQAEEVEAAYGREVGIDIQSFPRFLEELGYD